MTRSIMKRSAVVRITTRRCSGAGMAIRGPLLHYIMAYADALARGSLDMCFDVVDAGAA